MLTTTRLDAVLAAMADRLPAVYRQADSGLGGDT